jgi:hypothetical protein
MTFIAKATEVVNKEIACAAAQLKAQAGKAHDYREIINRRLLRDGTWLAGGAHRWPHGRMCACEAKPKAKESDAP